MDTPLVDNTILGIRFLFAFISICLWAVRDRFSAPVTITTTTAATTLSAT